MKSPYIQNRLNDDAFYNSKSNIDLTNFQYWTLFQHISTVNYQLWLIFWMNEPLHSNAINPQLTVGNILFHCLLLCLLYMLAPQLLIYYVYTGLYASFSSYLCLVWVGAGWLCGVYDSMTLCWGGGRGYSEYYGW